MDIAFLLFLVFLLAVCRPAERFVHWRGPTEGSLRDVEREHLRLFTPPPSPEELR